MIDETQWEFNWLIRMGLIDTALIIFTEEYFDDTHLENLYGLVEE